LTETGSEHYLLSGCSSDEARGKCPRDYNAIETGGRERRPAMKDTKEKDRPLTEYIWTADEPERISPLKFRLRAEDNEACAWFQFAKPSGPPLEGEATEGVETGSSPGEEVEGALAFGGDKNDYSRQLVGGEMGRGMHRTFVIEATKKKKKRGTRRRKLYVNPGRARKTAHPVKPSRK